MQKLYAEYILGILIKIAAKRNNEIGNTNFKSKKKEQKILGFLKVPLTSHKFVLMF